MRGLPLLPAAVCLGLAFTTTAPAQVLDITVPGGGGPIDEPTLEPRPIYNDDYVVGVRLQPGWPFEPGDAAINALNVSRFHAPPYFSPFDFDRAVTLEVTGESITALQVRCQATHVTYDPVSNTYFGPNGLPVPCR